ncbi:nicotinate-nucleotide--dimethylbenzimidazole phosphoribosyltransferase [Kineosporia rhizophila]|uniref:nicotinate-nucleotide--dimethylbenzimidazole phosphoribosyltransferase n=1 Tax=Kineosporia rhizophila TaxID=84633 RepID=UPI001E2D3F2A|nr:nicotinate-nucleotide--dimethylbenzimidazole phosphoribosyltransferase [Kineosporia rhizophila]
MLEDELTRIAALVTTPDGSSGSLRARPKNGVPTPGGDRLDELTRWWSGVVGGQLPQRVEHFWLPHTGAAGPVRSEVVLHRFTAPRDPEDALDWGVATADDAVDDGTDLVLFSVPVPENDVTWQVAAAQVLGLDAVEAAGWPGPGQTDSEWIARVALIRDGLKVVRGNRKNPYRVLELLEHRELRAGTGLLLQLAARRTPAILDGPVAIACALLAARLAPATRSWWLAADSGRAVLTRRMLEELRLTAVTDLGLDDGDGTAARFALQLLETAVLRAQERNDNEAVEAAPVPVDDATADDPALAPDADAAALDGFDARESAFEAVLPEEDAAPDSDSGERR